MYGKDTICAFTIGSMPIGNTGLASESTFRLDATSDEFAIMYECAKDMTIDQVALNILNLTGTPTYQVSLQGVSLTTGDPDGTILGGGSPASKQASPTANGLQWITLDNSISVSQGDLISIVIEDGTSGTDPGASHYCDIVASDVQIGSSMFPYCATSTDTGSTWTPVTDDTPSFGFRNSGTTDDVMGYPVQDWVFQPSSITSNNAEKLGQGFLLPVSLGRRVKVHGIAIQNMFASQDFKIGIWKNDATPTVMAISGTLDKDTNATTAGHRHFFFATPAWLQTGVQYYAGIEHVGSGGNTVIYTLDVVDDDNMSAFHGYPYNGFAKYSGGSWTEEAGIMAVGMYLLISDWDAHGQEMQALHAGVSR